MSAVFLDTVGLLALWNENDQWHAGAQVAFEKLLAQRTLVLSTTFVLLECGNAAARRPYRHSVVQLRDRLEAANLLLTPTHDEWNSAWRAYEAGGLGDAGIVDHISFAVMRRVGCREAFTNDAHFRTAGFVTLF